MLSSPDAGASLVSQAKSMSYASKQPSAFSHPESKAMHISCPILKVSPSKSSKVTPSVLLPLEITTILNIHHQVIHPSRHMIGLLVRLRELHYQPRGHVQERIRTGDFFFFQ